MSDTGKPIRIDWPALLNRIDLAGKDPSQVCLFCLTEAGRQLLLSISQRLEWRATYRVEGYDYSDWDTLFDYVEDTIGALAVADCNSIINEIVTQVTTNVTNNVQNVVIQQGYISDACCYLETNPANTPPPSDTDPPGNSEDRDDLCIQAQIAHDNGKEFMEQVFTYVETGSGVTAAVIALLLGPLTVPLALLAILIGAIVTLVADDLTDDLLEAWDDMKHDIVCAIVNAISATAAKAAVDEVIDATSLPGVAKTFLKTLYSQAAINQIWDKTLPDPGGYMAAYCNDCAEWSNVAGIAVDIITEDGNKFIDVGGMSGTWVTSGQVLDAATELNEPHTVCIVETGKSAYFIGDTNQEGDFDGTPTQPWLSLGCHSGNHGPGLQSVAFGNFRLLVSTAENPTTWFWISAQLEVAPGYPDVAGEFIVDEGSGIVGMTDIPFNGNGEFYGKAVRVIIPAP